MKGTITVANTAAADASRYNTNKKVLFKNSALFGKCIADKQYTGRLRSRY